MPQKHTYPQTMLIELSSVSNVIAYMLNEATNLNILNTENAYPIAVGILLYNLNIRCSWLRCPNLYMNIVEIEALLGPLDLPSFYKDYLIENCSDQFMLIEDMASDFLDPYVPKKSWHIWTIEQFSPAIYLIDSGDYRIKDWAESQTRDRGLFARTYKTEELRRAY